MSNNIRIRTTPNGADNYVSVKLEQNFDFIEILSLKISQEKAYESFCSDYGALVGRITINNGFGVPNIRVSIFIPLDEIDKQNPRIRGLYPYETPNDLNDEGSIYNILPKENETQDPCYTPVGSFLSKNRILDNEDALYVYEKYYKYTAVTNASGDYMIFGIPLGAQVVHIDADISDLGYLSQKPYNLIEQGAPSEIFTSSSQFKRSKKLTSLPQIKTSNNGVNVRPFWGDIDTCQIGINRFDYDLNINFTPSAFFIGSLFGDTEKNSVNKNCRPRAKQGVLCEQSTGAGLIEMIRKTPTGSIEKFDINPTDQITDDGTWAYQIPMNLDYVVTDEFGNIVPSKDSNVGIPTKAEVRFRISMLGEGGRVRARGRHLVPHNPKNSNEIDFNFGAETKDTSFATLFWDKIYTVKSFIPRTQSFSGDKTNNYLGIKNVEQCTTFNQFPFNRADTFASGFALALLVIICLILWIIAIIVTPINALFCFLCTFKICIKVFRWRACTPPLFEFACGWIIKLKCSAGGVDKYYAVGAIDCGGTGPGEWVDCVIASLAEDLGLYKLDFYNDWINGALYFPLFKAKRRNKAGVGKFCSYDSSGNNKFADTTYAGQRSVYVQGLDAGIASYYKNIFYYAPSTKSTNVKLYSTDLVSLGSIKDCDWQGVPKIIDQIDSTTFSAPPAVELEEAGEATITGMCSLGTRGPKGCYFEVSCLGIFLLPNGEGSINIRRQCELFVDLLEFDPGTPRRLFLSRNELCTNQADDLCKGNPSVVIRDIFYLLNVYGTKSIGGSGAVPGGGGATYQPKYVYDTNLEQLNLGTSFKADGVSSFNTGNLNGSAYNKFRDKKLGAGDDLGYQSWGNSYYFYFGLVAGATAIELFKKKYFQKCVQFLDGNFIISTVVTNSATNSPNATDGCIEFEIVGGTGPFNIIITNSTSAQIPLTTATPSISDPTKWNGSKTKICNLPKGSYTIEVTDAANSTTIKTVEIQGPNPLNCTLSPAKNPTNPTCSNGEIRISIIGGTGNITYTLSKNGTLLSGTPPLGSDGTALITQLGEGVYVLKAKDSDNPPAECEQSIQLKASGQKLQITNVTVRNIDCNSEEDRGGSINFDVTGGTENTIVYRVVKIAGIGDSFPGTWAEVNSGSGSVGNLPPGDYRIDVKDGQDLVKGIVNGDFQTIPGECPQTLSITTFNNANLRVVRYLTYIIDDFNITENKKQCDPSKWVIAFNVRKSPIDSPPYRIHRDLKANDANDAGMSVEIDNFIPVDPPIAVTSAFPTSVNSIGSFNSPTKIVFELDGASFQINNGVNITLNDVGDCRTETLFIPEANIRKPNTRLRFNDTSQTGTLITGQLPYQRTLLDCVIPPGWSPGGRITGFSTGHTASGLVQGIYGPIVAANQTVTNPSAGGAQFFVNVNSSGGITSVSLVIAGSLYTVGDTLTIPGTALGNGTSPADNITVTVQNVDIRGNFTCKYEITWLVQGGVPPYTIAPISAGQTNKWIEQTQPNQNADQWLTVYPGGKQYSVSVKDGNDCTNLLLPNGLTANNGIRQITVM